MKMKRCFFIAAALVVLSLLPAHLSAQDTYKTYDVSEIPDGDAYKGWLTDTDGSVTGKANAVYLWINKTNFPDATFRQQLLTDEHNDANPPYSCNINGRGKRGYFLKEMDGTGNISFITVLNPADVHSLEGIEYLNELGLRNLYCQFPSDAPSGEGLQGTLDLSKNTELMLVYLRGNSGLTTLKLGNLTRLDNLDITYCTNLEAPDLSDCTSLVRLSAQVCAKIETLDLTNNTALEYLAAGGDNSPLKEIIGIGGLTNLQTVHIPDAPSLVPFPTFTHCPNLKHLDIKDNPQVGDSINNIIIDPAKNSNLQHLEVGNCQIAELHVEGYKELLKLICGGNQLTALDVTKNTNLYHLTCTDNQFTALDVTKNTELEVLDCSRNQLTALDVTKNTKLTELTCSYNQLTALDVTNNTELTALHCNNNCLRTLDLSKNTKLSTVVSAYQRSDYDLKVFDHKKIGILLPGVGAGESAKENFDRNYKLQTMSSGDGNIELRKYTEESNTVGSKTLEANVETHDGEQYLIIGEFNNDGTLPDEDLYAKYVMYSYYTGLNDIAMSNVVVQIYPYIMNLHKNSKTPANVAKSIPNDFFSGTLYLDYDAVVPKGAEAYVITSTQEQDPKDATVPTADKVNLKRIATGNTANDVVPAFTPIYVKSDDKGWYDFQDAKRIYGEGNYDSRMTANIPPVMTDTLLAQKSDVFKDALHTYLITEGSNSVVEDEINTMKQYIEFSYMAFTDAELVIEAFSELYSTNLVSDADVDALNSEVQYSWENNYKDSEDDIPDYVLEEIKRFDPAFEGTKRKDVTLDTYRMYYYYFQYSWNGTDDVKTMIGRRYKWGRMDFDHEPSKDEFVVGWIIPNYYKGRSWTTWEEMETDLRGNDWVEEYCGTKEPTQEEFEIGYLKKFENCNSWDEFRKKKIEYYLSESEITNDDIKDIFTDAGREFYKVYNSSNVMKALPDVIKQLQGEQEYNILQGMMEDYQVGSRQVLTLTRETGFGTGVVGFWRYTGEKISAHRCYISMAHLSAQAAAGAKGFEFNFGNDNDDNGTTGITTIDNNASNANTTDTWHTLDGRRLNTKPTQKGIYIHNGRKEVVR